MIIFFLVIVVISAVLLVLIVMMQDEQGEGLGGIFGGGSGSPFGSRTGNVLTKMTTILAVVFLAGTLVLALLNKTSLKDSTIDAAREAQYGSEEITGWYTSTVIKDLQPGDSDSLLLDIGSDDTSAPPDSDGGGSAEIPDVQPNSGDTPSDAG